MEVLQPIVLFVGFAVLILVISRSNVLSDLFRGGPRPPSHPIPGDDSIILNRRRTIRHEDSLSRG